MVLITINRALAYIFLSQLMVNIVDVYRLRFIDVYCKIISWLESALYGVANRL